MRLERLKSQIPSQATPTARTARPRSSTASGTKARSEWYGADCVQDERRRGDLPGAQHGGDEGEGAEQEQDGCRGQCDTQRAVPERRNGLGREVP